MFLSTFLLKKSDVFISGVWYDEVSTFLTHCCFCLSGLCVQIKDSLQTAEIKHNRRSKDWWKALRLAILELCPVIHHMSRLFQCFFSFKQVKLRKRHQRKSIFPLILGKRGFIFWGKILPTVWNFKTLEDPDSFSSVCFHVTIWDLGFSFFRMLCYDLRWHGVKRSKIFMWRCLHRQSLRLWTKVIVINA